MECMSCGRPLASGAKCVYCGRGTQVKKREELQVQKREQVQAPKGSPRTKTLAFAWGRFLLFLLLAAAVAACFVHPGLNAKIRSLIP